MDKCVNCQFYDRHPTRTNDARGVQWGQCRREAPRLQPVNAKSHMIEGVWPHVRDDDWCGELKSMTHRVEPRIMETASGPLVNGFNSALPMPARPSSLSSLANGGASAAVTPLPGLAMGGFGRGD